MLPIKKNRSCLLFHRVVGSSFEHGGKEKVGEGDNFCEIFLRMNAGRQRRSF